MVGRELSEALTFVVVVSQRFVALILVHFLPAQIRVLVTTSVIGKLVSVTQQFLVFVGVAFVNFSGRFVVDFASLSFEYIVYIIVVFSQLQRTRLALFFVLKDSHNILICAPTIIVFINVRKNQLRREVVGISERKKVIMVSKWYCKRRL